MSTWESGKRKKNEQKGGKEKAKKTLCTCKFLEGKIQ